MSIVAIGGCATVDARHDYEQTGIEVRNAIGQSPLDDPASQVAADEATLALLRGGLTSDESVKLALLNNPRARAVLLRVGIRRADVVQAGLWSNPTLGLSFRLPDGGGLANFEMGLAQNIADLWMIPSRKQAATRELDREILAAARELVGLAVDTKVAYFDAVAADEALAIAKDNVTLTGQLFDITKARLEAGTVGSLDANLAKGQALRAEADRRTARLKSASARRTLATLLGLTRSADTIVLAEKLPTLPDHSLGVEPFIATALDARLDARAARASVEAAAARVEFEVANVFPEVFVGLEMERGDRKATPGRKLLANTARSSIANGQLTAPNIQSRGQRRLEKSQRVEAILGPSLSLSLPIFDQNQAQIAKARMAYLQAKALMASVDRSIVQEVREAADQLATAADVARMFREQVLPQAEETLALSRATYRAGQTTILNVIDAQRSLLETRRANVAALRGAANAMAELERATGRPIEVLRRQPTTAPAMRSSNEANEG